MKTNFVFVVPAYNCQDDITQSIKSVYAQSYDDWRMVIYDDMSTDKTVTVINDLSKKLGISEKIKVISREEKYGETRNTVDAVRHIDDHDVVCRLDAGDWLTELDTLAILNTIYTQHDPAVVWTAHRWGYTSQNISGPLSSPDAHVYTHPWVSSHLKTFRRNAMKGINEANFKDAEGNWIMIGCDQAVFLPMLHKAFLDNRSRLFLPICCYHYNINLGDPDLFTCDRSQTQKKSAEWIRMRGYIE